MPPAPPNTSQILQQPAQGDKATREIDLCPILKMGDNSLDCEKLFYNTGVNLQPQPIVCINCYAVRCNVQCYPYPTCFWGVFVILFALSFCMGRRRGKRKGDTFLVSANLEGQFCLITEMSTYLISIDRGS